MWYIKDRDWTICWSCIRFFMTIKETKLAWKLLFHGKSLNDFNSQKRRWKNALWHGDMRTKRLHKLTGGGCRNEYQWLVGRTLVKYFHGLNAWPFLHLAKVPRLYQLQPFQTWTHSLGKAVLESAACAHYAFFHFAPAPQLFIMIWRELFECLIIIFSEDSVR